LYIWNNLFLPVLTIIIFLVVGYIFTVSILSVIYENIGVLFRGNVWVNWFGVSYLFFFLYTVTRYMFNKDYHLMKNRMTSILFWILFLVSVYVIVIPFIKGQNPF